MIFRVEEDAGRFQGLLSAGRDPPQAGISLGLAALTMWGLVSPGELEGNPAWLGKFLSKHNNWESSVRKENPAGESGVRSLEASSQGEPCLQAWDSPAPLKACLAFSLAGSSLPSKWLLPLLNSLGGASPLPIGCWADSEVALAPPP